MSDNTQEPTQELTKEEIIDEISQAGPNELTLLKDRAKQMGIGFSNAIGVDALREKIKARLNGESIQAELEEKAKTNPELAKRLRRKKAYDEARKRVRVRVTCYNPEKNKLHGEIYTVQNNLIGRVQEMVPFGASSDAYNNGWHLPKAILNHLADRKFLQKTVTKHPKTGRPIVVQKWVPEFGIEYLPPLTEKELKELSRRQLAARGIDPDYI